MSPVRYRLKEGFNRVTLTPSRWPGGAGRRQAAPLPLLRSSTAASGHSGIIAVGVCRRHAYITAPSHPRGDRVAEVPYRVEKPWGYELIWACTDRYVGKVLHVRAGHVLSLQYHNRKDETMHVFRG